MERFNFKNFILYLLISFIIFPKAAYAYGGPGVGIGILIVFITVIIAFFSSLLISVLNFFKNLKHKLLNKNKGKNKK